MADLEGVLNTQQVPLSAHTGGPARHTDKHTHTIPCTQPLAYFHAHRQVNCQTILVSCCSMTCTQYNTQHRSRGHHSRTRHQTCQACKHPHSCVTVGKKETGGPADDNAAHQTNLPAWAAVAAVKTITLSLPSTYPTHQPWKKAGPTQRSLPALQCKTTHQPLSAFDRPPPTRMYTCNVSLLVAIFC